jgi:hypothetical protein
MMAVKLVHIFRARDHGCFRFIIHTPRKLNKNKCKEYCNKESGGLNTFDKLIKKADLPIMTTLLHQTR